MSYAFDPASTQYLTTSAGNSPISALPYTMACWVRPDTQNTQLTALSMQTSSSSGFFTPLGTLTTSVRFQTADTVGFAIHATGITANNWHHLCGVARADGTASVYRGGNSGETSSDATWPASINALSIGAINRNSTSKVYFDGLIAECAIWNIDLTVDEITSLAKGFSPIRVRRQNIVFYAPLIRDIVDARGAKALTNEGTATVADHPRII